MDTETILASGIINLNINDFTPYSELAGVDIKGAAKADIHLIQNNDAQSLSIDGKLTNLAYADMTVSSAALQANVPDISKTWPESLSLKVERLRIIDNVGIATLNADLSPSGDDSYKLSLDAKGRA